jgi:hypothetical protein
MSITAQAISTALLAWPAPLEENGELLFPTHCLYPSNSSVTVSITGGVGSFFVNDGWGAIEEVSGAGGTFPPTSAAHIVRYIVSGYGLSIDDTGLIKADRVSEAELLSTTVLVANASKDAATELLSRFRPRLRRNLKAELAKMLEIHFPKHVRKNQIIVGASNKPHRFDNVVRLTGDKQLVLDIVTREASSINAALVAHLDVRNAMNPNIEQRIIYDDQEKWSAADLTLLKIGAAPVPFSRAPEVLERLAA